MTNPIEQAVAPLKEMAIERSVNEMQAKVDFWIAKMEEANWDAEVVAPYPNSGWGRAVYKQKEGEYRFVRYITKLDEAKQTIRRIGDPEYRVVNEEGIDLIIQNAALFAAAQYEAYVNKLNFKIGKVVSAELIGNRVWNYSILCVSKEDGTTENWKTQIIVNVSSLGKLFNQWPTRKLK